MTLKRDTHDIENLLRRIKRLLRRRGTSCEDAEDLVQEAVLRLHVYTRAGNEVRDPESFMARTALNLAVDAHRHAHGALWVSDPHQELTSVIDTRPLPDEVLAAEDRLIRVMDVLEGVSKRTREVFFMHRLQGFSHAEIAQKLGVTKSAVEKHIASAVTALAIERQRERE